MAAPVRCRALTKSAMVESEPGGVARRPLQTDFAVMVTGTAPLCAQIAAQLQGSDRLAVIRRPVVAPGELNGVDAVVHGADEDDAATADALRACRAAGIPCIVAYLTPQVSVVAADDARDRAAVLPGCPECARLYIERAETSGSSLPSARVEPEDTVATACLAVLALCNAIEAAKDRRTFEPRNCS